MSRVRVAVVLPGHVGTDIVANSLRARCRGGTGSVAIRGGWLHEDRGLARQPDDYAQPEAGLKHQLSFPGCDAPESPGFTLHDPLTDDRAGKHGKYRGHLGPKAELEAVTECD